LGLGATPAVAAVPPAPAITPGPLAAALAQARARRLASGRAWQVLVHYRPGAFGGWKSEAEGLSFFLAGKRGRTDPDAELEATLTALFQTPAAAPETEQPQCRFPARTAWLRGELGLDERALPARPCPAYQVWRDTMAAQAVTLVYATAYLNSPASLYGHTFLRLSRATGEGNPLLDYAVNFAADVDTTNGFVYAIKGVSGGFPGRFTVLPYYVKVQEYSNMESRDLWEYELSLPQPTVDRLVAHTWELRSTQFGYFFFTRNCSYQLLTLLEAADPDLHLVDGFWARVIPADTVRVVLAQQGLVRRVQPRPAILSTLGRRKTQLSGDEVRVAERWAKLPAGGAPPELEMAALPKQRQALVIDAGYDYMRFREGLTKEATDDFKQREQAMLIARGKLGVPPEVVAAKPTVDAPERGHRTLRLSAGGGFSNQVGSFERLSARGSIHDYLDPPGGYPEDSELEMAGVRARFDNESRRLRLDRLDALNILSLVPYDRWIRGVSWKLWAGAENARELGCDRPERDPQGWRCLYGGLTTGGGLAARFGPRRSVLSWALIELDAGSGPAFATNHYYRAGGGGELGLAGGAAFWRWEVGARYIYYPVGERGGVLRAQAGQAVRLGDGTALRLCMSSAGTDAEASAEVYVYF
jgi:hypothetical protein